MFVGTVVGTVVAPIQHPFLEGKKQLLVRIEDPASRARSGEGVVLAIDRAGAGVGDRVLVMKEGSSARDLFEDDRAPVRTVIVGIVDEIEMNGQATYCQGDESD
jgi:ethanolamine utilization protein EutN